MLRDPSSTTRSFSLPVLGRRVASAAGAGLAAVLFVAIVVTTSRDARGQPAPVVGGSPVPRGAWPDVVAVIGELGTCSGTLIAPDVVLTAGHCIDIAPVEVVTQALDYAEPVDGERIGVKWARAYPRWSERFDAGVLVLEHVARPRPRAIATACLANRELAAAAPVTVVGYGLTTRDGSDDNTRLRQASVPVIDAYCTGAPGCAPGARPMGEFAAGGRGTDSCFGDSGGPAFLATPHGPALVGIVSRGLAVDGSPCGNGGVYVRADKVVAWAQAVTERRFERVACEGPSDDPEVDSRIGGEEETDDAAGCAAGAQGQAGSAMALAVAAACAGVWRRGRRRRT